MGSVTSRLVAVWMDANDPLRLARFWADALGWVVDDGRTPSETGLVSPDEISLRISFRRAAEPKAGQNRAHFDLTTTSIADQQGTVARLLERGARHVDIGQGPDIDHVVLGDPEDNEFCVIPPDNTFLAGCGRLGAINCDGTRDVGLFWTAALGWPLVWDQNEETAIRSPDVGGPLITWSGPPLMPRLHPDRLHFEIAPTSGADRQVEIERLVSLGATHLDGDRDDADRVVMADPDGNQFWAVRA